MGPIVVSNHLGFLDIPVLLSIYPAVFIIKDEIGRLRLSGKALKNQGHIFVKRDDQNSRKMAGKALGEAVKNGDRVIVFPEGRACSTAKRLPYQPFSFFEAERQNKPVEVVALDYLPNREQMIWDPDKSMFLQFLGLLGKREHEVSVEFLASEVPTNPREDARRWREVVEQRLSC
jgi:1-acyl-sn-glycerol-3-phosphate acyltransferase